MSDFVVPEELHPRERYRATVVKPEGDDWPRCRVSVQRRDFETELKLFYDKSLTEKEQIWEEVTTYDRNYSFMKTFEPFRQLRDGVWRDYALISRDYTYLEVMDLETGEVIATEQPSDKDVEHAREVIAKNPDRYGESTPEDFARTWGFCPVEFYVPDWWDDQDGSVLPGSKYWSEEDERVTGEFGVCCGCVWGDDSGWKIQYVDLSRISEGIVTTDDRFGYVMLPIWMDLKDAVRYSPEGDRISIAVDVAFDRESGKAGYWTKEYLNWAEKPKR